MENVNKNIEKILIQQLEKKGIGQKIFPRFIKDLINSRFNDPNISLIQVKNHMNSLGWEDINLDYHTFQLAMAYVENNNIMS